MKRHLAAVMLVLTGSAAALAAEPPKGNDHEKSVDDGDKRICKRFTETGSLVKAQRICKTKRDWERERDAIRTLNNKVGSCAGQAGVGGC